MPETTHTALRLNIHTLAKQQAEALGFATELSPEAQAQLRNLHITEAERRDMTQMLWSSIDGKGTKDLDQVEYAEKLNGAGAEVYKLYVGIADVDALVPQDSPIDARAEQNATSIYTGTEVFSMLPAELSTNESSLRGSARRAAIVTELTLSLTGEILNTNIVEAWVINKAKLDYGSVGDWLEGRTAVPENIASVSGMTEQILLQRTITGLLENLRRERGALEFESLETEPVVQDGAITGIRARTTNIAKRLIEYVMIAANTAVAQFLDERKYPVLERVVASPRGWPKILAIAKEFGVQLPAEPDVKALSEFLHARQQADPEGFADLSLRIVKLVGAGEYTLLEPGEAREGHFGLALQDYAHSTAPNRRFADLITQRLIKSAIRGTPPTYTTDRLEALAKHCTERDHAAKKVERNMRKIFAASYMKQHIGQSYTGVITGMKQSGTFVRIFKPPVEGMLHTNSPQNRLGNLEIGDIVNVRLTHVDEAKGFIDFEMV